MEKHVVADDERVVDVVGNHAAVAVHPEGAEEHLVAAELRTPRRS